MTLAFTDLPLFAPPPDPSTPVYLVGLKPRVITRWLKWRDTDDGRAVIEAAADVAREKVRAGASRLFIDDLVWEVRARPPHLEIDNTIRAPLARYLMHAFDELRGCFAVRHGKTSTT